MPTCPLEVRSGQPINSSTGQLAVRLFRAIHHRPTPLVLPEHAMHHCIHLRADADGLHDFNAQAGDQVTGDDDLADETHA
jgi:hypothetical protein